MALFHPALLLIFKILPTCTFIRKTKVNNDNKKMKNSKGIFHIENNACNHNQIQKSIHAWFVECKSYFFWVGATELTSANKNLSYAYVREHPYCSGEFKL